MNNIIKPKDKKIIALVGIMGSGKTTIGKRLATNLNINFIDCDNLIEKKCNKKINEIFAHEGEKYFREIEEEVIIDVINEDKPCVLSLGGGAFVNDNIRKNIKEKCVSIWLNVDLDIILQRIGSKTNRPLLNNVDKREVLSKLISKREPFYKQSDIEVNGTFKNHQQAVDTIISQIQNII